MKDRIKFNDAMLSAVMDGRKTQTRRPIKPQPKVTEDELRKLGAWQEGYTLSEQVCAAWRHGFVDVDCPYGEIGDIINVADKDGNIKGKIEITDVWLQQIQEISPSDAIAEGIKAGRYGNEGNWLVGFYIPNNNQPYITAKNAFKELWSSIYGIGSWRNNDWVWVISFKKVE
ncbi:hypothetical protein AB6F62_21235 [Providencia huaxiensis]|uniref:hypothetical protein n=1 Tax=Providencia huaxiensis TaxID=2027290 RepID=UPI0034DDBD6F